MKFPCCSWCLACGDRTCTDEGEGSTCDGCGNSLCTDCSCPNGCDTTTCGVCGELIPDADLPGHVVACATREVA